MQSSSEYEALVVLKLALVELSSVESMAGTALDVTSLQDIILQHSGLAVELRGQE